MVSVTVGPGLDFDAGQEKALLARLMAMYAVVAASRLLRGDATTRAEVTRGRITQIRRLNRQIDTLTKRIPAEVAQSGTSLTDIYGIGALVAAGLPPVSWRLALRGGAYV